MDSLQDLVNFSKMSTVLPSRKQHYKLLRVRVRAWAACCLLVFKLRRPLRWRSLELTCLQRYALGPAVFRGCGWCRTSVHGVAHVCLSIFFAQCSAPVADSRLSTRADR